MNESTEPLPVEVKTEIKLETVYPSAVAGETLTWTGTTWASRNHYDLLVYYTSVSQGGAALYFGPNPRNFFSGGTYTISKSLMNDDTIGIDTPNNVFFVKKAGTYIVEFSVGVNLNIPETELKANFVSSPNQSDPFATPGVDITFARVKTTGVSGTLCGKVVRDFVANETFGIKVFGQSSGAASYYPATFSIKQIA